MREMFKIFKNNRRTQKDDYSKYRSTAVCAIKSLRRQTNVRLIFGNPCRLHSASTKTSSETLKPRVGSPLACTKDLVEEDDIFTYSFSSAKL